MEDAWVAPQQLLAIIRMLTDVSFCSFLIFVSSLVPLRVFPLPPHCILWMFPDPVLATVIASSLESPGIRDLRLTWSPVSPLIHSQVALCTVNDLDHLMHNLECVVMGSQGDSGICSRLDSRLHQRQNRENFSLLLSSANLVFLIDSNKILVTVELIRPQYTLHLFTFLL